MTATAQRSAGRPRLDAQHRKEKGVLVLLDERTKIAFAEHVARKGSTVSAYMRQLVIESLGKQTT